MRKDEAVGNKKKMQCCGSGSGSGAFLTPGSGIRKNLFRIPDPKPIFLRLKIFSPLSVVAVFASGIRDPRSEIPGSGMANASLFTCDLIP
jgi:hypothetical protein